MFALRGVLLVLALAIFQSHAALNNYVRFWSIGGDSRHNLTKGTLFVNYDDSFPLASCRVSKPNLEKTCAVTLTKRGREDRICENIKIAAGKDRELFLGGLFQVLPFSDDKAILAWYDNSKGKDPTTSKAIERDFKISILDFGKCTTASLSFPIDRIAYGFFPAIVFYNNQLDLVLNSKASCGGADRCKLTYDLNGKQIGGIKPYEPQVSQYATAVSPASPDKGFFMSNQDLSSIEVLLVDDAGKGKQLLKSNLVASAVAQRVAFSNGHELYGTCWTSEEENNKPSEVHCAQFDAAGKQKFKATVKAAKPVQSLSVRNLPEGGLILLTTSDAGEEKSNNLKVSVVDKSGNVGKQLDLEGPSSSCFRSTAELEVRVYENPKQKYCFEYACLESNKKTLTLRGRCVPAKDLQ